VVVLRPAGNGDGDEFRRHQGTSPQLVTPTTRRQPLPWANGSSWPAINPLWPVVRVRLTRSSLSPWRIRNTWRSHGSSQPSADGSMTAAGYSERAATSAPCYGADPSGSRSPPVGRTRVGFDHPTCSRLTSEGAGPVAPGSDLPRKRCSTSRSSVAAAPGLFFTRTRSGAPCCQTRTRRTAGSRSRATKC